MVSGSIQFYGGLIKYQMFSIRKRSLFTTGTMIFNSITERHKQRQRIGDKGRNIRKRDKDNSMLRQRDSPHDYNEMKMSSTKSLTIQDYLVALEYLTARARLPTNSSLSSYSLGKCEYSHRYQTQKATLKLLQWHVQMVI